MSNQTPETISLIKKLYEELCENTENAISFLVIGLNHDEDEINSLGCLEIFEILKEEIFDYSLKDLKEIIEELDLEDFSFKFVEETIIDDGNFKKPCKNPCPECPYKKNSPKGYFGGQDPLEYANAIHQDTIIPCHSRTKYNENTEMPTFNSDIVPCTGHLVAQIKVCKRQKNEDAANAQDYVRNLENIEELKQNILGFDFKKHHEID